MTYINNTFKWYELPIKWMMNYLGWTGYTHSAERIYFTLNCPPKWLVRHENTHAMQMKIDGFLVYRFKWTHDLVKGLLDGKSFEQAYLDIPYEKAARANERG